VRRRVEEAIQHVGYRPDLTARALRTGRSGLLGLAGAGAHPPGLVDEIVRCAAGAGFRVVLEPPGPAAGQLRVDGLLSAEAVTPGLIPAGVPVVLLARPPDPRYDCVAPDAVQAARDATDHLIRTGRRRIAAVGGRPGDVTEPHTIGYQEALRRAGLPPGNRRPTIHQRTSDGYHATRELLAHGQRPDAIFCCTDRLAIGAIRAAADAGFRVPEDVAVIGIGDSETGRYSRPTLSTVATDPAVIARRAVELLTHRLHGTTGHPMRIVVPHEVLPRESTGAAPAGSR
jgi:DNA-binding LacI/PurR family transcriptional regulator